MDEREEKIWVRGNRAAWLRMLRECLRQLGIDDPDAGRARWIQERQDSIAALRMLCDDFGDNEWEDSLYLSDVIEKHLGDHLQA
jgi:hypothetical protein